MQILRRTPPAVVIGLLALILVVAVLGAVWLSMVRDNRKDLMLSAFAPTAGSRGSVIVPAGDQARRDELLNGFADVTGAQCGAIRPPDCVQAFAAERVSMYRFTSESDARTFAAAASERYQSDWIVIEFTDPSLSNADRSMLERYVDGTVVSY